MIGKYARLRMHDGAEGPEIAYRAGIGAPIRAPIRASIRSQEVPGTRIELAATYPVTATWMETAVRLPLPTDDSRFDRRRLGISLAAAVIAAGLTAAVAVPAASPATVESAKEACAFADCED